FGMAFSFTRPIRYAMSISEQIAAGNFATAVASTRRDELGRLLASLDQTQAALREMHEAKERDRAEQLRELQFQVEEERRRNTEAHASVTEEQSSVVRMLADGLRSLAGGDLTVRLSDGFTAAYRQIRDDFNSTVEQLQETIGVIATSTREVAGA